MKHLLIVAMLTISAVPAFAESQSLITQDGVGDAPVDHLKAARWAKVFEGSSEYYLKDNRVRRLLPEETWRSNAIGEGSSRKIAGG